nr:VirK family protein [Ensifer sp. WSM1721]
MCTPATADTPPTKTRGGVSIDGYRITSDGTLAFADQHFTIDRDGKPIVQFLRYRIRPDGGAEFTMVVFNVPSYERKRNEPDLQVLDWSRIELLLFTVIWHVEARSRGFGWRVVLDRRLKGFLARAICEWSRYSPPAKDPPAAILKLLQCGLSCGRWSASIAVIEVLFDHAGRV